MNRQSLQRMIHVACRQMRIDQETRRDLQLVVTGKASMADMEERDLHKLVDALRARGFKPDNKGKRPPAPRADIRYCHVLWRQLHQAGAVRVGGAEGLNAFIRSRFGNSWGAEPIDIDALRDWRQIADVVDALKAWCQREGIDPTP